MRKQPLVVIVDDDVSVRESLANLLRQLGYAEKTFESAEELMASDAALNASCLIPTILITGRTAPDLLEEGVIACLFKPFSDQELESALDAALREKG